MGAPKLVLEVIRGVDRGARVALDAPTRTIGRARHCDLVLHDGEVSRPHAVVVRTKTGARLEICEGAKPAIVKGRTVRQLDLQPGIEFILGTTTIAVLLEGRSKRGSVRDESDAETEISGVGASARHLTALAELVDVLDAIDVVDQLESRMRAWCIEQDLATDARLDSSATRATTISISKDGKGMVHVAVPIPDGALVFAGRSSDGDISESLRKVFVMASRLFSSALTRAHRLRVIANQAATFRTMSLGSAKTFLGSSEAARRLARFIPHVATSNANVLLEGETGSGKTFVAHLIHECGPRAKEPLRVINCAADAIESELFGHKRGAFAGALASRVGEFELAGCGTVLLEEIAELPLSTQAKLVHVLDERRFERLGSSRTIPFEARVLSTSNRDLEKMIAMGDFRADLFHRIAALRVKVPTLRERSEDVLLLAEHIVRDLAGGWRVEGFSKTALRAIAHYAWPGNVRELRHAIEHALMLDNGPTIEASDLPPAIAMAVNPASPTNPFQVNLPMDLKTLERCGIEAALAVTRGNRTHAAELLGISRQTIHVKIAEFESSVKPPTAPKTNDR